MVPRSAAAALNAAPGGLARLASQATGDADVEGYYLSPSALGRARAPGSRGARDRARVSGGWPPPRLHPLPGPGLRLLARRPRGLPPPAGGEGRSPGGPSRNPGAWDEYRRGTVTALAVAAERTRRAASDRGLVVSAAVVPDEAQAVLAALPGLAAAGWPRPPGRGDARWPTRPTAGSSAAGRSRRGPASGAGSGSGPALAPIDSTSPGSWRGSSSPARRGPRASCSSRTSRWRSADLARLRERRRSTPAAAAGGVPAPPPEGARLALTARRRGPRSSSSSPRLSCRHPRGPPAAAPRRPRRRPRIPGRETTLGAADPRPRRSGR